VLAKKRPARKRKCREKDRQSYNPSKSKFLLHWLYAQRSRSAAPLLRRRLQHTVGQPLNIGSKLSTALGAELWIYGDTLTSARHGVAARTSVQPPSEVAPTNKGDHRKVEADLVSRGGDSEQST